jgi:hypothetical protein
VAESILLAHGVGRVYESPLPLWLYLVGAGATVAASFLMRALVPDSVEPRPERKVAGDTFSIVATRVLGTAGVFLLLLTLASGAFGAEAGLGLAALLFWVGLIVGTMTIGAVMAGSWERIDPWVTLERFYRTETAEPNPSLQRRVESMWLIAPVTMYLLFWFELVSGVGFDSFWIIAVMLVYTVFVLNLRAPLGRVWNSVDPLAILFGFAERVAPLRVRADGLYYRGWIRGLDEDRSMPRGLYAALFVLLASTTLDNVRETLGWTDFRAAVGLGNTSDLLVESVALLVFTLVFLAPFLATVWVSSHFVGEGLGFGEICRRFGWSLIPIGVAYVLAHNAPLVLSGFPVALRGLSDPFDLGWNLLGTANVLQGYFPSPALVWFLEIVIIVGGHILGVLAAHRRAVRLGRSHRAAVKSQYALTALMSVFTITTLWLLSQPLVT